MGESWEDRAKMLEVLANLKPYPESVPINALVPVKGTPLENQKTYQTLRHGKNDCNYPNNHAKD